MPIHMAGAVAPAAACPAKVSQRNAPGAISAIAFIVSPVKPNVGFISTASSAIWFFSLGFTESLTEIFIVWVQLNTSRSEVGLHQRGCSSQNLARTGLKTIVVMAGGCALQTSPHFDLQPTTAPRNPRRRLLRRRAERVNQAQSCRRLRRHRCAIVLDEEPGIGIVTPHFQTGDQDLR